MEEVEKSIQSGRYRERSFGRRTKRSSVFTCSGNGRSGNLLHTCCRCVCELFYLPRLYSAHARLPTNPAKRLQPSCSIHKCWKKNLTSFKLEPTTPNMSQHIATGWANERNMLRPTMLRSFGLPVKLLLHICDLITGTIGSRETV